MLLFQANFSRHPKIIKEKLVQASEKALAKSRKIKENTKTNGPQLKMGDKVYLLTKNLKI